MMRTSWPLSLLSIVAFLATFEPNYVEGSIVTTKQYLRNRNLEILHGEPPQNVHGDNDVDPSAVGAGDTNEAPASFPLLADQFDGIPGFYHGVASGDPLPTAVILWTRFTPESVDDTIEIEMRIAEYKEDEPRDDYLDPEKNSDLRYELVQVDFSTDFTLKLDVTGLSPNTRYVYAFTTSYKGDYMSSQVGQTKTAPADNDAVTKLTYAILSCAVYTNGYFHAYDVVSTMTDLDFWFFVGDYIYEYGKISLYASDSKEREAELMPEWETVSLQDYRLRYALYHTDEGLQNLRRRAPVIAVWDDHEVADNDYGKGEATNSGANNHQTICPATIDDPIFYSIVAMCEFDEGSIVDRMEGAAQAYFEWMPVRRAPGTLGVVKDQGSLTKVIQWGDMATLVTFDSRVSSRSEEPTLASVFEEFESFANQNTNVSAYTDPNSPVSAELNAISDEVKAKMADPQFTMVGGDKVALLGNAFMESKKAGKPWQIYGSSTLMGPNIILNPDTLWMFTPESIQDDVKTKMDELLASEGGAGDLLRILTAMAVSFTPWNRDDFNGFANERAQILDICKDHANNAIIVGGDLHDSWGWIMYEKGARTGKPVAVNVGASGVTAPGIGEDLLALVEPIDELLEDVDGAYLALQAAWKDDNLNPGLVQAQIRNRGFVAATVTKEEHISEYYHISAEDLLDDYPIARARNDGGLTSEYFCSGKFITQADEPGSFEDGGQCGTATFETEERPWEWSIPVPPRQKPEPTPAPTSERPRNEYVSLTPVDYEGCMTVDGRGRDDDKLLLGTCDASKSSQKFTFDGNSVRSFLDESKCLQAGRSNSPEDGNKMRIFECDGSSVQKFRWNGPRSPLTLVDYPEFCVVFRGVRANVNHDPIILKRCDAVETMRRGWEEKDA